MNKIMQKSGFKNSLKRLLRNNKNKFVKKGVEKVVEIRFKVTLNVPKNILKILELGFYWHLSLDLIFRMFLQYIQKHTITNFNYIALWLSINNPIHKYEQLSCWLSESKWDECNCFFVHREEKTTHKQFWIPKNLQCHQNTIHLAQARLPCLDLFG